jgi:lysozyme
MKAAAKYGAIGVSAAACVFIVAWEGNKVQPYLDIVGVPTVCAGVTRNVYISRIYTAKECSQLNRAEIQRHADDLSKCVKVELSPQETTAYVSWVYNVGSNAACESTLIKQLNAGNRIAACSQLLRWNRANGKEIKGLTNRRNAEYQLCLEGANGKN